MNTKKNNLKYAFVLVAFISSFFIVKMLLGEKNSDGLNYVIGFLSIFVTASLGLATYFQTKLQIEIDQMERLPFFVVDSLIKPENIAESLNIGTTIPVLKKSDDLFVDVRFRNVNVNRISKIVLLNEYHMENNKVVFEELNKKNFINNKLEKICKQEKVITKFNEWLNTISEFHSVNELYDRWEKLDKRLNEISKNSNYVQRVRELILGKYVCFFDMKQKDWSLFRDNDSLSQEERREILSKYELNMEKMNVKKFNAMVFPLTSITHQLDTNILEWTENKDILKRQEDMEKNIQLDESVNEVMLIKDCIQIYFPIISKQSEKDFSMKYALYIETIYDYSYVQFFDLGIVLLNSDESQITDEVDILKKENEIKEYHHHDDSEHDSFNQSELEKFLENRGKAKVTRYVTKIVPSSKMKKKDQYVISKRKLKRYGLEF